MKDHYELTLEQRNLVVCYILMTTQYRKKELEAWRKLAKERRADGSPVFSVAEDNARYFEDLETRLSEICKILDC